MKWRAGPNRCKYWKPYSANQKRQNNASGNRLSLCLSHSVAPSDAIQLNNEHTYKMKFSPFMCVCMGLCIYHRVWISHQHTCTEQRERRRWNELLFRRNKTRTCCLMYLHEWSWTDFFIQMFLGSLVLIFLNKKEIQRRWRRATANE